MGARGALFIVALVATALLVFAAPSPASAQLGPEDPSATTVPGAVDPAADPAAGTETTVAGDTSTTAVAPEANVPGVSEDSGGSTDTRTSRRLLAIIGGLLGIGFLILVLTVLYWRSTKPGRRTAAEPEWVEGEGWVSPHETEEPDPVKMQRKLQRRRRRREDRAAAPVGEWFAEPDPTLDPFAPDAPTTVPVVPSGDPQAPVAPAAAPGPEPRPRTRSGAPPAPPVGGNGNSRARQPRPAGGPADGRGPAKRQAPPGTQPQRVAKKPAPAPGRRAATGPRPAAPAGPPRGSKGQGRPARQPAPQRAGASRSADQGPPPGARRRPPQGVRPPVTADPSGQARRPRPAPVAEDWDAQTDELAEFWQEMRNKDA